MGINQIKTFLLDIFFPKICLNCQKEGEFLCQDCLSTLEILDSHQKFLNQNLADLYFALPYQNRLIKKLIQKFKYQPFIKELSQTLALLIITHFQLSSNKPNFFHPVRDRRSSNGADFILIPVPLEKKRLKWRGFNPAEEIGKELSLSLKIPFIEDVLIKIKETQPQVELTGKERKENLKGAFLVKNGEAIRNKKILLVDDIYTTGSTMEACAMVLKEAEAKEIVGIVVARAKPEDDRLQNI